MSLFKEECDKCHNEFAFDNMKEDGKKIYCITCYDTVKIEKEKKKEKAKKKKDENQTKIKTKQIDNQKIKEIEDRVFEVEKLREEIKSIKENFIEEKNNMVKDISIWMSSLRPNDLKETMENMGFNKNKVDRMCIQTSKKGTNRGKSYRDTEDLMKIISKIFVDKYINNTGEH